MTWIPWSRNRLRVVWGWPLGLIFGGRETRDVAMGIDLVRRAIGQLLVSVDFGMSGGLLTPHCVNGGSQDCLVAVEKGPTHLRDATP